MHPELGQEDNKLRSESGLRARLERIINGSGKISLQDIEFLKSMEGTLTEDEKKLFQDNIAAIDIAEIINEKPDKEKSEELTEKTEANLPTDLLKAFGIEDIRFVDKDKLPEGTTLVSIADLFMGEDEENKQSLADNWVDMWAKMVADSIWIGVAAMESSEKNGVAMVQYCSANEIDRQIRERGGNEDEIKKSLGDILSQLRSIDIQYSQQIEDQRDTSSIVPKDSDGLESLGSEVGWVGAIKYKSASADPTFSPKPTWAERIRAEQDAQKSQTDSRQQ